MEFSFLNTMKKGKFKFPLKFRFKEMKLIFLNILANRMKITITKLNFHVLSADVDLKGMRVFLFFIFRKAFRHYSQKGSS